MQEPFGSLYCLTNEEVIRIDTGIFFPNGIAVKHNASGKAEMLIVAETPTKLLWAYDIDGPGRVKNKRKWATLPGILIAHAYCYYLNYCYKLLYCKLWLYNTMSGD